MLPLDTEHPSKCKTTYSICATKMQLNFCPIFPCNSIPCIMENKAGLHALTTHFPERIETIAAWEREIGSTFFPIWQSPQSAWPESQTFIPSLLGQAPAPSRIRMARPLVSPISIIASSDAVILTTSLRERDWKILSPQTILW